MLRRGFEDREESTIERAARERRQHASEAETRWSEVEIEEWEFITPFGFVVVETCDPTSDETVVEDTNLGTVVFVKRGDARTFYLSHYCVISRRIRVKRKPAPNFVPESANQQAVPSDPSQPAS